MARSIIDKDLIFRILEDHPTHTIDECAEIVSALTGVNCTATLIRVSMHRAGYVRPKVAVGGAAAPALDYEFEHALGGVRPVHRRTRTYYELRCHERVQLGLTPASSILASAAEIRFRNLRAQHLVVDYDPATEGGFYVRPAYPWESGHLPSPFPEYWREELAVALAAVDACGESPSGWSYTERQVSFYREVLADLEGVA